MTSPDDDEPTDGVPEGAEAEAMFEHAEHATMV